MKNNKTITIISLFILLSLSVAPVFSQGTIVDIAVDDPDNFSTLVAAVTAADLVDTLNSEGPFTVFAPTNAAFDALPDGVLDYLLANTAALTQVLTYHVVEGEALSTDLSDGDTITTIQGDPLTVSIDGTVMINDATVAIPDVDASNGVIHVIDKVLVPEGLLESDVATVQILSSTGGTTNPAPGTYTYPEGETITLIATPNQGYTFQYWVISGTYLPTHEPQEILPNSEITQPPVFPDYSGINSLVIESNRLDVTCGFGYTFTYQPVFTPTDMDSQETDATVIVADSVGGTTDPEPGTYIYPEGETITLVATANQGFEFEYWLISGTYLPTHNPPVILPNEDIAQPPVFPDYTGINSLVIESNRLDVTCGYGYTFTYQPVFSLIDGGTDDPNGGNGQPDEPENPHGAFGLSVELVQILIVILVVAVIVAIGFGAYLYTKQKK